MIHSLLRILALCLLALPLPLWAVETVLVGEVRDAETGDPIENASIYYRYTKIGTTTNADGFFMLRVDQQAELKLIVSAVGYKRQVFTIVPGDSKGMHVQLEPKATPISEIVVSPGSNPAIPLMAKVREHAQENSMLYDGEIATMTEEIALSQLTSRHLSRRIWKNLRGMMQMQADSTFLLPIYRHQSDQYDAPHEYWPLYEAHAATLLDGLPDHINFYRPTIPIYSLSVLSPVANTAPAFYQYFLVDSIAGRYIVHFRPKNAHYALFAGEMEIDSLTYAITRMDTHLSPEANTGLLRHIHIQQEGTRGMYEHQEAVFDVAVRADTSHLFPSLFIQRTSVPRLPVSSLSQPADSALIAARVTADSVRQALVPPLFRVAQWAGQTIATGYMPMKDSGYVELGHLSEIIGYSQHEGLHLGIPLRTSEYLWKNVALEGNIGYGFHDRRLKGMLGLTATLPTQRRHLVGLRLSDRYVYTEHERLSSYAADRQVEYGSLPVFSYALHDPFGQDICSAARRRSVRTWTENDWWQGTVGQQKALMRIETEFSVELGEQYMPMLTPQANESYRFASVQGLLRLSWNEGIGDWYMYRRHFTSTYPNLILSAEMGSFTPAGASSYRLYGHLALLLRQRLSLGMGGLLDYNLRAGVILGQVPYPLLHAFEGRSGYIYRPERFMLMRNREAAADRYVSAHVDWDGQGILFNLIPGVRKLGLHELLTAGMAWGTLTQANAAEAARFGATSLATMPHIEAGFGIGHILRFFDVYALWQCTRREGDRSTWHICFRLNP